MVKCNRTYMVILKKSINHWNLNTKDYLLDSPHYSGSAFLRILMDEGGGVKKVPHHYL